MKTKLEEFKDYISKRKVAVLGLGISNTPLIKYLAGLNVDITAFDRADSIKLAGTLESLEGLGIKYSLGEGYLEKLTGFDVIFKTPVVRYDIPELVRARQSGAVITSEMEVFVDLCPAQIFAVTGSDGKTTTTTLIYNMLKEHGYNCWLGGNIGTPLLDRIDEIRDTDKVVLELSSFQLHTMCKSPHVAVITNLSPNHLDVHKSMEEYIEAKKNIFKYQEPYRGIPPKLVLNYDNGITRGFAGEAKGEVVYFSRLDKTIRGAVCRDGQLVYANGERDIPVVGADKILIPGAHNVENYLAATAAVIDYVDAEDIARVAASFRGVEHRGEPVRELNGVRFFNDSIGSSPTRTIATVKSFDRKVILIAGGYDKHIPYDEMGPVIAERVKCLVLVGATGPKIEKALRDEIKRTGRGAGIPVIKCTSMEEAVKKAYGASQSGDIVLLSPASSSFDMFKNFEERGNCFKEIVNSLE